MHLLEGGGMEDGGSFGCHRFQSLNQPINQVNQPINQPTDLLGTYPAHSACPASSAGEDDTVWRVERGVVRSDTGDLGFVSHDTSDMCLVCWTSLYSHWQPLFSTF